MLRKVLASALMTVFAGSVLAATYETMDAAPIMTKSVFDGPYLGLELGTNLKKQTVKSGSDVATTSSEFQLPKRIAK
jgi:hypothetical protein